MSVRFFGHWLNRGCCRSSLTPPFRSVGQQHILAIFMASFSPRRAARLNFCSVLVPHSNSIDCSSSSMAGAWHVPHIYIYEWVWAGCMHHASSIFIPLFFVGAIAWQEIYLYSICEFMPLFFCQGIEAAKATMPGEIQFAANASPNGKGCRLREECTRRNIPGNWFLGEALGKCLRQLKAWMGMDFYKRIGKGL